MLSQKSTMKDKLENMHLQERINYGYGKVISMMSVSYTHLTLPTIA